MNEQKVIKNDIYEYFIVKVNNMFVQGKNSDFDSLPVKLYSYEKDATKF